MDIKLVKNLLGKTVYYDTGQINFDGCSAEAALPRRELALSAGEKLFARAFFVCELDATSRTLILQILKLGARG